MVIELYQIFSSAFVFFLGGLGQLILLSCVAILAACGLIYCFWVFYKLIFRNDSYSLLKKVVSAFWMCSFAKVLYLIFLTEHSPEGCVFLLMTEVTKGGMFNIYFFYCWKSISELDKQKLKMWQLVALLVSSLAAAIDVANFFLYAVDRPAQYFINGFKSASFFQFPWSDVFVGRALASFIVFLAVLAAILLFLKNRLARPGFDFRKASSGIIGYVFWLCYSGALVVTVAPGVLVPEPWWQILTIILQTCSIYCLVYLATLDYKNKKDIWKKKFFFYGALGFWFASIVTYPFTCGLISILEFLVSLLL